MTQERPLDDDDAARLERHYHNSWRCSECGGRHGLQTNTCPHVRVDGEYTPTSKEG